MRGKRRPTAADKESAAIAICVRSVLGRRGRTLKRFSCGKGTGKRPMLKTQKPL